MIWIVKLALQFMSFLRQGTNKHKKMGAWKDWKTC